MAWGQTKPDEWAEGERLAIQIRSAPPVEELSLRGRLNIRDGAGNVRDVPFQFKTVITTSNWTTVYRSLPVGTNDAHPVAVIHQKEGANTYWEATSGAPDQWTQLPATGASKPFAGSDFSIADLGLEFLHWPKQRLIRKEMRRSRSCNVLESSLPGSAGPYGKVISWLDNETGGLIVAEAYDLQDKLLKEFAVKSMKEVDHRWQVQQMEIRNVQTKSRTRLDFEVK